MTDTNITATVALLAAEGVEQVELTQPRDALTAAGATVVLVSPDAEIRGFHHLDPADTFPTEQPLTEADAGSFDALILPGGVANPDALRLNPEAVAFIGAFVAAGKPVAAICHAPWTLIEADAVRGRTLTSWPSLQTDLRNAGATWVDEQVVIDRNGAGPIITSRNPDDLEAFSNALIEELA